MSTASTIVASMLANKANTRLALATALVERNSECEALRAEVSVLRATKTVAPNPAPTRCAPNTVARKPLPAHFAAAREAAMRSGRSVRVVV